ncbi:hypothetical protein EDF81_0428 [Enterobacter sp. BIGb0383]|uniref:hypothetical protein n=1 Tax=unclassified Enterobacter TaxID=2608935 RepID=UPI000F473222|nr:MULTISPECIES: hypothetical protein [unclassified Enterobacter]ROP61949.1 hypothetical protein EDF81_0428 [Enterobacter sp. BIGb0383]ROS12110.1 hypothetical protein EC848_0429 [Enterobacter sp. BIGb0359]
MQKILITNNHLHDIKGSELVTLELAEMFLLIGWQVTIYTNLYMQPLSHEFSRLVGRENLHIYQDPCEVVSVDFDIIWIQQNTIPPAVIDALATTGLHTYIIWHHMSSFIHIELPLLADVENALCDVVTCISPESAGCIAQYGIDEHRIALFDNPAPDTFADYPRPATATDKPASLLLVSNHLPEEVRLAIPAIQKQGVAVIHLGDGSAVKRLNPALLSGYDAVLTIGKTVQYALSMGLPVYEYDHFGGYGWLTEDNFDCAARMNFSGRASGQKKTSQEIAHEIVTGYRDAKAYVTENSAQLADKYRLSNQLSQLLQRLSATPSLKKISARQALQVKTFTELHRGLYRTLMYFKMRVQEQQ